MSRYNTGNPIDSGALKDLSDNAKNLDVAMNRTGMWRDRFNVSRLSLIDAISRASSGAPLFSSVSEGMSETAVGGYFSVYDATGRTEIRKKTSALASVLVRSDADANAIVNDEFTRSFGELPKTVTNPTANWFAGEITYANAAGKPATTPVTTTLTNVDNYITWDIIGNKTSMYSRGAFDLIGSNSVTTVGEFSNDSGVSVSLRPEMIVMNNDYSFKRFERHGEVSVGAGEVVKIQHTFNIPNTTGEIYRFGWRSFTNNAAQIKLHKWDVIKTGSTPTIFDTIHAGEFDSGLVYRDAQNLKYKQAEYSAMYNLTNESIANGDMLATVYDFMDGLVSEFPLFVSRRSLGNEYTGIPVYAYTIKPFKINKMASSAASINTFPTIALLSGQHGQEYSAIVNLMIFLDEMMRGENIHDTYANIRSSFNLEILPAMNPWGVRNADRRNSRGVDLNRNFPVGWDAVVGDKGESAMSELESQYFSDWMISIKENLLCSVNMHDHSDASLTWGTASSGWPEKFLFKSFQQFGTWYRYNFTDPDVNIPVSWLGNPRDGYSDKYLGETLGVDAILFECPYINHPKLPVGNFPQRLTCRELLLGVMGGLVDKYYRG